jgi:GR25 family glycosyltransferase involved in LPS biosynthesis
VRDRCLWTWQLHEKVSRSKAECVPCFPLKDACRLYGWPVEWATYGLADRVVVINLATATHRLASLKANLAEIGWPLREPQVMRAVDGYRVQVPSTFTEGGPAYGCLRSHCRVLEEAMMDDLDSVMVLEDDCVFRPDFSAKLDQFLPSLPDDWDALFLGGQHKDDFWKDGQWVKSQPPRLEGAAARIFSVQRTHCYLLRRRIIPAIYQLLANATVHCDWLLGNVLSDPQFKVYAPLQWLAGQRAGYSYIRCVEEQERFWSS